MAKLEIIYDDDEKSIDASAIADDLDGYDADATDDEIKAKIKEHLDDLITDGPWPSFRVRGMEPLIEEVREALANRETEED